MWAHTNTPNQKAKKDLSMSTNLTNRNHPIVSSHIVMMTHVEQQEAVNGVDYVKIKQINYDYMRDYMKLGTSFVWGLKLQDGALFPVEVVLPIQQDLDGWVAIHKSHKMFDDMPSNPREFAKQRINQALAAMFTTSITQKSLSVMP